MWRISEGLYLGTKTDAANADSLKAVGITHVLNCTAEVEVRHESEFQCLRLPLKDPDENFLSYAAIAREFIDKARSSGGAVLVHCHGAVSRCPAVVMAYLLWSGLSLAAAAELVSNQLPTHPSECFATDLNSMAGEKIPYSEFISILGPKEARKN